MNLADYFPHVSTARFVSIGVGYLICFSLFAAAFHLAFPSWPLRKWHWLVSTALEAPVTVLAFSLAYRGRWISAALATAVSSLISALTTKPRRARTATTAIEKNGVARTPVIGELHSQDGTRSQKASWLILPEGGDADGRLLCEVANGFDNTCAIKDAASASYWRQATVELSRHLAEAERLLCRHQLTIDRLRVRVESPAEILPHLEAAAASGDATLPLRRFVGHWREMDARLREAIATAVLVVCRVAHRGTDQEEARQ